MQRIALLQLTIGPDPAANLPQTLEYLEAAAQGADFILTPECSNFLCTEGQDALTLAVPQEQDSLLQATQALARKHGIWICLGSLVLAQEGRDKLANRQVLVDPEGKIITTYDKIHLFDVSLDGGEGYRESRTYDRGIGAKVSRIGEVRLGHAICYDLRFPSLFRKLRADVQLLPAAFTRITGQAHWHTLLRARAIENGCFVLAAAQTGLHDGTRRTYGHSLAIDPWGEILLDMGTEPGVGFVDLDLGQIARRRAQIPAMTADQPFEWTYERT